MILLDLQDVFRIILGAHRVQYLLLRSDCSSPEASALDFQFRDMSIPLDPFHPFAE